MINKGASIMRFLFASDSFKGSLSSAEIAQILAEEAKKVFPDCETIGMMMADGGEGTMEAVCTAVNGQKVAVPVHNPLFEPIMAEYGYLGEGGALIEMSAASGLTLIPEGKREPRYTSSYGTGELIAHALDRGIRQITVAIGGSATNDGGMGAMRALGVRFLSKDGKELSGCGADLIKLDTIDISGLHTAVKETTFTVMRDVTNPLTGSSGATYTFGRQKGGNDHTLPELETGMIHYAQILRDGLHKDVEHLPGAGAAGGLGAALVAFLDAKLVSGIETVLQLSHFEEKVQQADLVITGEGRLDHQSCYGKVISGVGAVCKKHSVPAIALVGAIGEGAEGIYEHGITSAWPTVSGPMELQEAMERSEVLYRDAAQRLFRMLLVGNRVGGGG
jgi:glycerate kinase